mgnify:CR=1 FL=1
MTDSIDTRVANARAELEATLDAIEDKFNVPKRVGECVERVRTSYERDPRPWILGAAAGAVVLAGAITWAVIVANRD